MSEDVTDSYLSGYFQGASAAEDGTTFNEAYNIENIHEQNGFIDGYADSKEGN